MQQNQSEPQKEDPRLRFRKLLSEVEPGEKDPSDMGTGKDQETLQGGDLLGNGSEPEIQLSDTRPNLISTNRVTTLLNQETSEGKNPLKQTGSEANRPTVVSSVNLDPYTCTPVRTIPSANQLIGPVKSQPVMTGQGKPSSESQRPKTSPVKTNGKKAKNPVKKTRNYQKSLGCFLRTFFFAAFFAVIIGICLVSFTFYQYFRIASTLPDINDLKGRASKFETTRILDRRGNTLYEILDPNAGRRTYIPLEKISPYLLAATIATEDKEFYSHPGVDFTAILRAFWQNYQGGGTVSGASTITQQLARTLLFSPEERYEQSYQRKIREAILATEITRRYSKDEILELYLNENNYGNLAYGIEAASETYFGTTADKLSLGQASFLAGIPQAPAVYDVYTNPEDTYNRHEDVLVLMYQDSQQNDCIFVSNSIEKVCMDAVAVTQAADEIRNTIFKSPDVEMRYPHWVNYVRTLLESQFDPQTIYRSGFSVTTTLDPGLQDLAQNAVKEQVSKLSEQHVTNGAVVIIQPVTGEILAMVGSADFGSEAISGQVNMAVSPRQPGSALKPLTYLAAFEKGWTPSTVIWDVPTEFSPSGRADDPSPVYKPVNYTGEFYGPVSVRTALANSLNIPAVKALEYIGIYDDPNTPAQDGLISIAKRAGITTLNRPDYGLSLTLGGGEVSLLELTNFYATLANNGTRIPPVAITKIVDRNGNTVYEHLPVPGEQVFRSEHSFLISSILSDNQARKLVFGQNSVLKLPFPVAAKTGTTDSFRDNWTMGYTPDVAVGVWVGNADYTPMINTTGLTGAAPIWSNVIQGAIQQLTGNQPSPFSRPSGIVEMTICELSGTFPSEFCPQQTTEIFASDQPPLPKEQDLIQRVNMDTWTRFLASPDCRDFTEENTVLNVKDQWARKWIKKEPAGEQWIATINIPQPVQFMPSRECRVSDPRPKLAIVSPGTMETITQNPLQIYIQADATEWFDFVRLEYATADRPNRWKVLEQRNNPFRDPGIIYEWDLTELPAGVYMLKLYMHSTEDTFSEIKIPINLQVPTPTPTPTPTEEPTPTPTLPPTETETPIPSETPVPVDTPIPSETPTPTP